LPGRPLGTLQVYVLRLSDGSATQLTFSTDDAALPAWSPDGATIVFNTQSTLYAISPEGGAVRAIPLAVRVNGGASWSPDGGRIAFLADNGQVWVANADGSDAHQVTYTLLGPGSFVARPAWSPDGGEIAWTQGADLCVTDLSGNVRRLTHTQQSSEIILAALPGWQPSVQPSSPIVLPPTGSNDTIGCDWNPGVRVELLDGNVSSSAVALKAPQELVFVNHTRNALTVTTTLRSERATIDPGGYFGFSTEPGTYDFAVSGYPDGVARRGYVIVAAAGNVTIEQHTAIRYGTRTVLTGAAVGRTGGAVTIKAQASGSNRLTQIATVTTVHGRWQLSVAPRITTQYQVTFEGATVERLLRVMPDLRVERIGGALRVSLKPAAALAGDPVFLFRLGPDGWTLFRTARTGRDGVTLLRNLPSGRYYVGFQGSDRYWNTASEPFSIHR
jgi:dipeptidyl aminopeptidase/acylaminoacyl peptidase